MARSSVLTSFSWFITQGQKIDVENGIREPYGSTLAEGEQNSQRHCRIVMSSSPPTQLPRQMSDIGWKDVGSVKYKLTKNDMKLKNRQIWKLKKKYWKAEFFFVVKLGPADLKFQIVGKNGLLSSDHDSLEVDFLDPSNKRSRSETTNAMPVAQPSSGVQPPGAAVSVAAVNGTANGNAG